MTIPAPAVDAAVRTRWPHRGPGWSEAVSAELEALCAKHGLSPGRTYDARYAVVVHATRPSGAAVVIRSSADPDAEHQAAVLQRLADAGLAPAVHAVETTPTATVTVSDAVEPGISLRDASSDQRRAVDVIPVLRVLAEDRHGSPGAPDLVSWLRSRLTAPPLDDMPPHCRLVSAQQRHRAIDALDTLGPPAPGRLCHGDLSPGNALIGRDRLWLIDPRGVNGEPAYDVAVAALKACLDDPIPAADVARSFADAAGTDPDRAAQWVPIAAAACV